AKPRFTSTPRDLSIGPTAPSQTTTPSRSRSRNGSTPEAWAFVSPIIEAVYRALVAAAMGGDSYDVDSCHAPRVAPASLVRRDSGPGRAVPGRGCRRGG